MSTTRFQFSDVLKDNICFMVKFVHPSFLPSAQREKHSRPRKKNKKKYISTFIPMLRYWSTVRDSENK